MRRSLRTVPARSPGPPVHASAFRAGAADGGPPVTAEGMPEAVAALAIAVALAVGEARIVVAAAWGGKRDREPAAAVADAPIDRPARASHRQAE